MGMNRDPYSENFLKSPPWNFNTDIICGTFVVCLALSIGHEHLVHHSAFPQWASLRAVPVIPTPSVRRILQSALLPCPLIPREVSGRHAFAIS